MSALHQDSGDDTQFSSNVRPALDNLPIGRQAWKYLVLVCLLIISFPGDFEAARSGLDSSWIFALNVLPHSEFVAGRDFVHTYGPLGFLLHPLNIGSNLVAATAFRVSCHLLFAACLFCFAFRAKSVLPLTTFAIGYSLSLVAVITLEFSYQLLVLEFLLFSVSLTDRRLWWIAVPLAAMLAALLLFIKFGIGVAAAAMLAPATAVWILRDERSPWKVAIVVGGFYLATIGVLAGIFLQSLNAFFTWIQLSLIMSNEFSVAQSIVGSRLFLVMALFSIATYLWLVRSLFEQKSNLRFVAPVLALTLFLAFKHGFVRVYGHERNFFPFLLAAISVLALGITTRRECKTIVLGYVLVLTASVPVGMHYASKFDLPSIHETLFGLRGYSNLVSTINLADTRHALDAKGSTNLAARQLPIEWVKQIQQRDALVDVIPWELSYVFANGLKWKPNVTLQLFNSYAPVFDRWNAEHFAGADAPDFLIIEFLAIDGRHLLLDTPSATRSILNNYSLKDETDYGALKLLEKRAAPKSSDLIPIGTRHIGLNEWVDVPSSADFVFADLDISLSPVGWVMKFVFRIPPVYLDVIYDSGRAESFRFKPAVAKEGLLVNYLPADQVAFADLLKGCAKDRVSKFRIGGPGTRYYTESVDLQWERGYSPPHLSEHRKCSA